MGLTLINHEGQTPLQNVGAVSGKNFEFFLYHHCACGKFEVILQTQRDETMCLSGQ